MTSEERARELLADSLAEKGLMDQSDWVRSKGGGYTCALRAIVRAIEEEREACAGIVDERAEACRGAGIQGGIDPIEASILDEHLSEAAAAIRQRGEG